MSESTSPRIRDETARLDRSWPDLAAARAEYERVGQQAARMQARQQQLLVNTEVRQTRRMLLQAMRRRRGADPVAFLDEEFLAVADRASVVQAILTSAITAGAVVACDLQRYDPPTASLRLEAQRGLSDNVVALITTAGPAQPGISTLALSARQPVIVADIELSPVPNERARAALRTAGIRAVHAYPLLDADSEVHAVLSLHYWQPSPRRDTFDRIAKAAAQALSRFLPQPDRDGQRPASVPGKLAESPPPTPISRLKTSNP